MVSIQMRMRTETKWAAMNNPKTAEFAINGAQPFSRNALVSVEASAGTGKTYSLTTTIVRLVAEQGIRADQILLMTFTNEATGELRLETRRRCREALAALAGVGSAAPWMQHMQAAEVRDVAIERLEEFLARYDEVTISTIHGFCQSVLRQAGLDGEAPANFDVVPNIDPIIDQVVTDLLAGRLSIDASCLYGTKWKKKSEVPTTISNVAATLYNLREVVKTILNNEGAQLLPAKSDAPLAIAPVDDGKRRGNGASQFEVDVLAQTIADTARAVVDEVRERCLRAGIVTYNDIVRLVALALNSPTTDGQHLADHLASQYPIIMVDEFQDTDAIQWQIFDKIFTAGRGKVTLITVGDPKQAIYRFRGADVNVYLAASKTADESFDLRTNRRSDAPLLKALEVILENETFDVKGDVAFKPVNADPAKTNYALGVKDSADVEANLPSTPLEIRWIPRSPSFGAKDKDPNTKNSRKSNNAAEDIRTAFFSDAATRVVDILNWATIPDADAADGSTRAVKPSDIAILVNTHAEAGEAVRSLQNFGVGAVKLKTGSVFQTEAARHWLMLLKALANPGRPRNVRTYALSWFGGLDEDALLGDVDPVIELQRTCAHHAELMQREGITALYMTYRSSADFLTNVLDDPDGVRNLTDLDHIAETLGSMPEFATSAGPLECLDVLADLIENADGDADEQKRRIETDRDSVTVMTIYASKGLQFPIVILPTLNHVSQRRGALMFPAELADGVEPVRVIDVASPFENAQPWNFTPTGTTGGDLTRMEVYERSGKNKSQSRLAMTKEDIEADARRLFYVAMTRAKHKLVCYWSPIGQGDPKDPFSGSLTRAAGLQGVPLERDDLRQALDTIATKAAGSISHVELSGDTREVELIEKTDDGEATPADDVANVATFERAGETVSVYGYGRWSYSTVTKGLKSRALLGQREAGAAALPGASDESNTEDGDAVAASSAGPIAWAGLPAGAGFGNDVHMLLDRIDPAATNLGAELETLITEIIPSLGDGLDRTRLASAITANLGVKLVDGFEGRSLAELGRKHRLSELRFDFPLPRNSSVGVHEIVGLAVKYGNLSKGVLDDFERMGDAMSGSARIAGYMNGSIDAVFRISGDQPRYIVCDYKTNKLHKDDDPNPIESYGRASMEEAMLRDGYFFQAMIYSVALQRYLRQRQPGYDFETHFAGVSYLFLRGLDGSVDANGNQRGNYFWKPPKALIDGLDTLFTEKKQ